jgi:hypothetical protein
MLHSICLVKQFFSGGYCNVAFNLSPGSVTRSGFGIGTWFELRVHNNNNNNNKKLLPKAEI